MHVLERMKANETYQMITICINKWDKTNQVTIKEIRVDPEASIFSLKAILLNFTENKPFYLRFNLDNNCKIQSLIDLST